MAQHGKGCWDVAGIEGEQEFERLLYNRCSGVIITQFRRRAASGVPVSMLYGRSRGGARYAPLFDPNEDLSYEEPASAASAPILICNVLKWDETGGGDWHGVARTDLDTRHVFPLLQERDLPIRDSSFTIQHMHVCMPQSGCLLKRG